MTSVRDSDNDIIICTSTRLLREALKQSVYKCQQSDVHRRNQEECETGNVTRVLYTYVIGNLPETFGVNPRSWIYASAK